MPTEGFEPFQEPGMGWRVSGQEKLGQLCALGGPPWRGHLEEGDRSARLVGHPGDGGEEEWATQGKGGSATADCRGQAVTHLPPPGRSANIC